MPLHHVNPRDIPTSEDSAYWRSERMAYHIPPNREAPIDAIDFVVAKYRENDLDIYTHDPRDRNYEALHPKFTWALASATMAHFAWFKTIPGAHWINEFFGVEEVSPFYEGYCYYWVDKSSPNADPIRLTEETGSLRIFRQWERSIEPPCVGGNSPNRPFVNMVKLFEEYRSAHSHDPGEHSEEVFNWVSITIRDWFLEPQTNERWPFYKQGRISGSEWVRQQKRSNDSPFYEAIQRVAQYHHSNHTNAGPVRAYRIEDVRGNVHWCPGTEIRIIPTVDYHRRFNGGFSEAQVIQTFTCRGCRHVRTCVPYTNDELLCCNCYAKEIEQGTDMPTLNQCTMLPECKACPERIDSNSSLISLKQKWNRSPKIRPVPR